MLNHDTLLRMWGGARAAALVVGAAAAASASAPRAQTARETPLLELDLRAHRETRIDAQKRDSLDADLDAALGRAVGAGAAGFSTATLDRPLSRLVADLARERPRAP